MVEVVNLHDPLLAERHQFTSSDVLERIRATMMRLIASGQLVFRRYLSRQKVARGSARPAPYYVRQGRGSSQGDPMLTFGYAEVSLSILAERTKYEGWHIEPKSLKRVVTIRT
jgi:hypothetical protein